MSGWTEREHGTVRLIHHSTSSTIKMIVTTYEEVEQGKMDYVVEEFWFDYTTFEDLKKAIAKTD